MKKLCVLIPTMNRPLFIKELFDRMGEEIIKYDIDVYIYDTSSNEDTKTVVDGLDEVLATKVNYNFIEQYPDRTVDLKLITAFSELRELYEYIWLSGDGCILQISNLITDINKMIDGKCDLVYFKKEDESENYKMYDDASMFFRDCGWYATYYCATIVSSMLIKNVNFEQYHNLRNTGFMYWSMIFTELSKKEIVKIAAIKKDALIKNPLKKTNSSYGAGKFLWYWAKNWFNAVDGLPEMYNLHKSYVCKILGKEIGSYGNYNLVKLRVTDNLNIKLYKQYKAYLNKVTEVSKFKILCFSIVPKWMCRLALKLNGKTI